MGNWQKLERDPKTTSQMSELIFFKFLILRPNLFEFFKEKLEKILVFTLNIKTRKKGCFWTEGHERIKNRPSDPKISGQG